LLFWTTLYIKRTDLTVAVRSNSHLLQL